MHKQLLNHLEKSNLLFGHHFGFRSKRSTEPGHHIFYWLHKKEADKGLLTGAIFVNLSKVFYIVSHARVPYKPLSFGITGKELMCFTNYLFNRT